MPGAIPKSVVSTRSVVESLHGSQPRQKPAKPFSHFK